MKKLVLAITVAGLLVASIATARDKNNPGGPVTRSMPTFEFGPGVGEDTETIGSCGAAGVDVVIEAILDGEVNHLVCTIVGHPSNIIYVIDQAGNCLTENQTGTVDAPEDLPEGSVLVVIEESPDSLADGGELDCTMTEWPVELMTFRVVDEEGEEEPDSDPEQ